MAYQPAGTQLIKVFGANTNQTVLIPGGHYIQGISVVNTGAGAVLGGVRMGTTSGAADVVVALTVGANSMTFISDAALLKRQFSAAQTLFVQAVASWNSSAVDVTFLVSNLN